MTGIDLPDYIELCKRDIFNSDSIVILFIEKSNHHAKLVLMMWIITIRQR